MSIIIILSVSAPRTNQQSTQQQTVNKPALGLPSPGLKPRVVTPELPTVPCPLIAPPAGLGPVLSTSEREEESLEQIEEDIREYNRNVMESIQNMVATINGTLKDEKDEPQQLPKLLITKEQSIFNIPPNISPKFINIHFIGEAASKVLFSTVHWARQLPYFSGLQENNKIKILKRCWLDLFVLGLAQCQDSLHVDSILSAVVDNVKTVEDVDRSSSLRVRQVTQNICKLKQYLIAINKLELSSTEFGLLKIIAMFNTDPASINSEYYETLSDRALTELREQPKNKENGNETRYSKLLLKLSPLRSLQEDVFEEIFFGGLIGNVQIETVVPILLQMEESELIQYLNCEN